MFPIPFPFPFPFPSFNLSATISARIIASIVITLFCLCFRYFSFDHYDKITFQMHATLIAENSIEYRPFEYQIVYHVEHDDREYYEFEEDEGNEDYELYNDEE